MSGYKFPKLKTEDILSALEQMGIDVALSYKAHGLLIPILENDVITYIDPDEALERLTGKAAYSPPVTRLKTRPQFLKLRSGPTERRKSLVVQARARKDQNLHIGEGFTATKKVGNAVIRNRAKRRLREAARQLLPRYGLPGADYVFIARLQTATIGWQRLLDDMESALISLADDLRGRTDGR